ncbi:ankyrin repeat domain-containing protein [Microseira wollei]|uniref:Ankyrin n=1 Tax=Microseira wollei NIES-4236 TaxID=2530354 RepID=A0AAV3XII5_9CYAN|nr:ankyrin repeat domain-containing protein [Microseira wollei]GET41720.1 ankyrin [Microseira wollei NIES-4236]
MSSLDQQLRGDAKTVEAVLAQGANVNVTGGVTPVGESNTALMWAAAEGHLDVVNILLAHGADVNVKNDANYTALMYAAERGDSHIISCPREISCV